MDGPDAGAAAARDLAARLEIPDLHDGPRLGHEDHLQVFIGQPDRRLVDGHLLACRVLDPERLAQRPDPLEEGFDFLALQIRDHRPLAIGPGGPPVLDLVGQDGPPERIDLAACKGVVISIDRNGPILAEITLLLVDY